MLTKTKRKTRISSITRVLAFEVWTKAEDLPSSWCEIADEPLFSKSFFEAIESAQPKGMRFLYVGAKDAEGQMSAVFYFQLVPFHAHESLNYRKEDLSEKEHCPSFFGRLQQLVKTNIARKIEFDTLVLGNLLLTGNYGSRFHPLVPVSEQAQLMESAINHASSYLQKSADINPPVLLIKEFYATTNNSLQRLDVEQKWHGFRIAPNHVFTPDASWSSMHDYLEALSSKYRVRYRRANKKLQPLGIYALTLEMLQEKKKELYSLYMQIAGNAGFNMVNLSEDYLWKMKAQLGDHFEVFGFCDEDKILGFFSFFEAGDQIDVHYIGLDSQANIAHQLYLNMLYFIIAEAIERGGKRVNFGRTAAEIKSSVGAKTFEMDCYIRHESVLVQKIISPLIRFLQPNNSWEERHPFKEAVIDPS
jgi:hypothetical protein